MLYLKVVGLRLGLLRLSLSMSLGLLRLGQLQLELDLLELVRDELSTDGLILQRLQLLHVGRLLPLNLLQEEDVQAQLLLELLLGQCQRLLLLLLLLLLVGKQSGEKVGLCVGVGIAIQEGATLSELLEGQNVQALDLYLLLLLLLLLLSRFLLKLLLQLQHLSLVQLLELVLRDDGRRAGTGSSTCRGDIDVDASWQVLATAVVLGNARADIATAAAATRRPAAGQLEKLGGRLFLSGPIVVIIIIIGRRRLLAGIRLLLLAGRRRRGLARSRGLFRLLLFAARVRGRLLPLLERAFLLNTIAVVFVGPLLSSDAALLLRAYAGTGMRRRPF